MPDRWAEDRKKALKAELKVLKAEITAVKKLFVGIIRGTAARQGVSVILGVEVGVQDSRVPVADGWTGGTRVKRRRLYDKRAERSHQTSARGTGRRVVRIDADHQGYRKNASLIRRLLNAGAEPR